MNTLNTRVAQLVAEGKTKKIIVATLVLEGYKDKDIKEATKDLGQAKTNFAAQYYDWLASEKRTMAQAEKYVMGKGEFGETSDNVKAHLSHYLNIAELTLRIWATK